MIAALPMYDWPELGPATDAYWAAVAALLAGDGIAAPAALTRPAEAAEAAEAWAHPELLLGQACGMPYVAGLCGGARVIGRPDYRLEDAADGLYRSVIVARVGEGGSEGPEALLARRGGRVALNEWGSFSGHIALRAHLAGLTGDATGGAAEPFFGAALVSGGHRESARMVARGEADTAALDAVAWALLRRHEPDTGDRLAVLDRTAPAPALPFITAPRFAALAPRLVRALDGAGQGASEPGLPRGVAPAEDADYDPIRAAARLAAREPFAPGAAPVPRV